MEKKQIKAKYIVVKQPDDNVVYRNNIRFIYIVITREELSKKIDNYLDGKIKRTAGVYAPLDLFAQFVTNPKPNVYKYVRYKDGNSANNHWSNLEWCRNQTGSKYGKS